MSKSIQHTFHYSHAPEVVWEYLTKPELIAQWLMPNDFEPFEGRDFQFKTKPLPQFEFDGIAHCKVLEIIPFKKLSYSWKGGIDGRTTLDSIVVWTLTPTATGTELHLKHSGYIDDTTAIYKAMDAGWLSNIKKIAQLIITKKA